MSQNRDGKRATRLREARFGGRRKENAWGVGFVKATNLEIIVAPRCLDTVACALHSWF
jgi:hypothetical protein